MRFHTSSVPHLGHCLPQRKLHAHSCPVLSQVIQATYIDNTGHGWLQLWVADIDGRLGELLPAHQLEVERLG